MNPQQDVQDWIRKTIASNDVVLFMKGVKTMPQCGFSSQVAHILGTLGVDYKDVNVLRRDSHPRRHQGVLQLADDPAALRQGRVRRRPRYRA
jgi:monothiol glutaredoxin